ncbi:enoyl-CoA hydratase/isomerase family protein [Marinibacterium profundimaris]|uniref:3-hydroxyisobutyryl-CoA hydrolase n=1 Tax=Marinibacterium profundimaris TaxID=1679460 RepID=A0A225NL94_9RHOB|nr:enoyl-CoA hydratase/isomerase family protein [Marinibacterium profundimaris]OWU74713.1 enoyl-CoA hydratase [Marinibacterium profundimaris]
MSDIHIRITGRAGRITLTRPRALNALTWDMCLEMDAALKVWAGDDAVALVVIDAEGDKAFCAGGDIAQLHAHGIQGDYDYARRFWRDEYLMNARLADFPKPVVSFMQGFTMGGGVGIGCHGSHRIVGDSSRMAMPECGIGLIPDVGGTYLLAKAPGRLGAYQGLTGARMGPGDAIHVGFADAYVPEDDWPAVIAALEESGTPDVIPQAAAPAAPLKSMQAEVVTLFSGTDLSEILERCSASGSELATGAAKALRRGSPLAMAATLEMLERLGGGPDLTIQQALALEYRFTWRAMEHGDFLEGIRAQIIDKDRSPSWRDGLATLDQARIDAMLAPLGEDELTFEGE